jgi:membrane-bound ClpP family serine protease
MGIGVGIVLLVVGLILLTGAVDLPESVTSNMETGTIGWICTLAGALALVLALVMNQQRSRTKHVEERRHH